MQTLRVVLLTNNTEFIRLDFIFNKRSLLLRNRSKQLKNGKNVGMNFSSCL